MTSIVTEDRLLTAAEVAEYLHQSLYTINTWCRTGRIKGVHVGKIWMIHDSELRAWLGRQSRSAQGSPLPDGQD